MMIDRSEEPTPAVPLRVEARRVGAPHHVGVLLGEMFPNRMRGAALSVSGATNWVANSAVTVTFLPLLNAAGLAGAYALYALAAALSVPFVWAAVGEARGKALEQM
jgi:SP family sugar:H+ symporter-like MFS transporter